MTAPPRAPAFVLGLGLGGFLDGIVLHQILQWHHMATGETGDLEKNTLLDGLFHLSTWVLVAAGLWLTLRAWRRGEAAGPWRHHVGLMLAGWGVFNVVEGTIDHLVLGIHHVRDDLGGPLGWDLAFLALGALLVVGGLALSRRAPAGRSAPGRAPSA